MCKSAPQTPTGAILWIAGIRWTLKPFSSQIDASGMYYRKRGSASYIVREVFSVREREIQREIERERRKWRHHCRAKIGDEFTLSLAKNSHELTLSLAKNSHFSFLPSHFPSVPLRRGYRCGAENRNEFTLSIAEIFFRPLCSLCSFKWHEPRDDWSKTQDKWSNPAHVLFCSSHRKNESNSYQKLLEIEKEIVREVALGD